jgi:hypothetical protein
VPGFAGNARVDPATSCGIRAGYIFASFANERGVCGLVGLYRGTEDEEMYAQRNGSLELVERRRFGRAISALIPLRDEIHACGRPPEDTGLDPSAHERRRLRLAAYRQAVVVPIGLRHVA